MKANYRTENTKALHRIEIIDLEPRDFVGDVGSLAASAGRPRRINSDFRDCVDLPFRGIVQLEGDSRLMLEGNFTHDESELPKN